MGSVGGTAHAQTQTQTQTRLVLPGSIGVSIHGTPTDVEIAAMRNAGISVVRLDLAWHRVETSRENYDWSYYDRLIEAISAKQLRPLLILAYSNPVYAPMAQVTKADGGKALQRTAAPADEAARKAFARWATLAATRYAKFKPIWELWNEPDHDFFWPPKVSADDYIKLATQTCTAIRAADPAAAVIGPGAAKPARWNTPTPAFLSDVVNSDLGRCVTAWSVHPYLNLSDADRTLEFWDFQRKLISDAPRKDIDFVASEWGLSTFSNRISDDEQAAYLSKILALDDLAGIPLTVWYNWRDNGRDGTVAENRFGLNRLDGEPKPAFHALSTYHEQSGGKPPRCRLVDAERNLSTIEFAGEPGRPVRWMMWARDKSARYAFKPPSGYRFKAAIDLTGGPLVSTSGTQLVVTPSLPGAPVYLEFDVSAGTQSPACSK